MESAIPPAAALRPAAYLPILLGSLLLLTCSLWGLYWASEVIVPSAVWILQTHDAPLPELLESSYDVVRTCKTLLFALGIGSLLLVIGSLISRKPRLISFSVRAFATIAALTACVVVTLPTAGGLGQKSGFGEELRTSNALLKEMDALALQAAADGRFEQFRQTLSTISRVKLIDLGSVAELGRFEAVNRADNLASSLHAGDAVEQKKRRLATLSLFRDQNFLVRPHERIIKEEAAATGVPDVATAEKALRWIAEHLHQDGWDTLPLFKIQARKTDFKR